VAARVDGGEGGGQREGAAALGKGERESRHRGGKRREEG